MQHQSFSPRDSLYSFCQVCKPAIALKIITSHCEPLPENSLIRMQISTNIEMEKNKRQPSKPLDTCHCHRVAQRSNHHHHHWTCSMAEKKATAARNVKMKQWMKQRPLVSITVLMCVDKPHIAERHTPLSSFSSSLNVGCVTSPLHNNLRDIKTSIVQSFQPTLIHRTHHWVSKHVLYVPRGLPTRCHRTKTPRDRAVDSVYIIFAKNRICKSNG